MAFLFLLVFVGVPFFTVLGVITTWIASLAQPTGKNARR